MDRGYPSTPAFLQFIDDSIYFVARLKSSDYKAEQKSMKSNDEDIEIKLTKARRRNYIGKNEEAVMMSRESFSLRLIKVNLNDGKSTNEFYVFKSYGFGFTRFIITSRKRNLCFGH